MLTSRSILDRRTHSIQLCCTYFLPFLLLSTYSFSFLFLHILHWQASRKFYNVMYKCECERESHTFERYKARVCVYALSVGNSVRYNSGDNANNAKLESDTTTNKQRTTRTTRNDSSIDTLHCILLYHDVP